MSTAIRELEPQPVWNFFSDLNAVPRPSKKEERVIAFMLDFAKQHNLEAERDEAGNVLIKKPATPGREDRPVVAIQSHLDMVHQKNSATQFDFSSEGIRMLLDGDWVHADGTTLGADNGIGVACAMAVLASDDIPHPPLEALFTIDEETGMTGAKALKGGLMEAKYLLNLDTEDDTELCIGCAGGVDVLGNGTYRTEERPAGSKVMEISVTGLAGGHSGMDIHRGRGNANKLMNRILSTLQKECELRLVSIDGGGLRNAIPRESVSRVLVNGSDMDKAESALGRLEREIKLEYSTTDPKLSLKVQEVEDDRAPATVEESKRFVRALYSLPNGIYRLSPDVEGLVQTSSNLARVVFEDEKIHIACLVRGSVDSEKSDLAASITSALEQIGIEVDLKGDYPGWTPKPDSHVLQVMKRTYGDLFDQSPHILACHAGLECGILGGNYPDMEMISFGPNIRGAHSPDERVQVSSVRKIWRLLIETLSRL